MFGDLDMFRISLLPGEADPVLVVNTDAMPALPAAV
jgi:hypothetical protein